MMSVLLPSFNGQPDVFAVMNCCAVALSLFFSDTLIWNAASLYFSALTHKLRVRVDEYAYCVNKLRQNVALET